MAVNIADLEARVSVDKTAFDRGMRDIDQTTASTASSGTKHFGALGSAAALAAGGAGIAVLSMGLHDVFSDMKEGDTVAAQTAAVIKSTGDASHASAAGVANLANTMSMKTGIDDEAIQSGENMLLTFTNVRNEVGKGNDVFNQSTKVLADMSTALGTDMSTQAIQLGKALNDPVKGMTALRRVGVTFTDQQKEQVAAMEKSGNTMGAQKLILGELTREFGGSAEAAGKTFSGQLSVLKMSLENATESVLSGMMPAITSMVGGVTALIPTLQEWGARAMPVIKAAISDVIAVVRDLAAGALPVLKTAWDGIHTVIGVVAPLFERVTADLHGHHDVMVVVGAILGTVAVAWGAMTVATTVWTAAAGIARAAMIGVNLVMEANPFVLVASLILALGVALVTAYHHSQEFRDIVNGVFNSVRGVVSSVMNFFTQTVPAGFNTVLGWVRGHWPEIATIISGPFAPIVALATGAFGIRAALTGAFQGIIGAVRGFVGDVVSFIMSIPSKIAGLGGQMAGEGAAIAHAFVGGILGGVEGLGSSLYDKLKGSIGGALSSVKGVFGIHSPSQVFADELGTPMGQGVLEGWIFGSAPLPAKMAQSVQDAIQAAVAKVQGLRTNFGNAWSGFAQDAGAAFDGIYGAIQTKSEKALAAMDAADLARRLASGLADAKAALQAAVDSGADPATLAAKQQAVADAEEAIQRDHLEKLAAEERKQLNARNDLRKGHFDNALAALQAHLTEEGATHAESHKQIMALFKKYGIDYANSGAALGSAFAQGLREQAAAVGAAAAALANEAAKKLKLHSPAKEGPLSTLDTWWDAFAPTLLSSLDKDAIGDVINGVASPTVGPLGGTGAGGVAPVVTGGRGAAPVTVLQVSGNTLLGSERETARQLFNLLLPFFQTGQIQVAA